MKFKLISSFVAICLFVGGLIYLRTSRPSYSSYSALATQSIPQDIKEEQALAQKVECYKMCMSFYYQWILNLQQVYFSWCTKENGCLEKGPSGKETRIFRGNFSIRDPKECTKKIAEVNKLKPHSSKLEATAEEYSHSVLTISHLLNGSKNKIGLSTYYQNYMDQKDQGEFARKQHPHLLKAWEHFFEISQNLDEQIDEADNRIEQKQLTEQKKQAEQTGKWLSFYLTQIRYHAKLILNQTLSLKKGDSSLFSAKVLEYQNDLQALSHYQNKLSSSTLLKIKPILEKGQLLLKTAQELTTLTSHQLPQSQSLTKLIQQYVEFVRISSDIAKIKKE